MINTHTNKNPADQSGVVACFAGSAAGHKSSNTQSDYAMNMPMSATPAEAVTMTSLEIVEFINSQRKEGEAVIRHDHFMAKVPKVLGETDAPNFRDIYLDAYNREQRCYRFPKREACLMAMSYSYDIQASVFDKMTALEQELAQKLHPVALPNFLDPAESAIAWAEQYKARQVVEQQLSLVEPKAIAFDNMVNVAGGLTFRTLAKDLNVNENVLRTFLKEHGWVQWIKNNMVTKNRAEKKGWAKTDSVPTTEYDDKGNVKHQYMKVTTLFTAAGKAALELAIVKGELQTKPTKKSGGEAA